MATLLNNHLYISSSKFSANWCATANYVGMVVSLFAYVQQVMRLVALVCVRLYIHMYICMYVLAPKVFTSNARDSSGQGRIERRGHSMFRQQNFYY